MSRTASALVFVALTVGCAKFATRTPTPAADLTREELSHPPPPPDERYYTVVFGSQSTPKIPRLTHSWVLFARVSGGEVRETFVHSWMPATLEIRTFARRPEPGVNLGLHESLAWAIGTGQRVSAWGPYEVPVTFYRRATVQKQFLESGAVGYQCIDSWGEAARTGNACNCYHAVTDMDPEFDRAQYPLSRFGEGASKKVVAEIATRGAVIDPTVTHDWLLPALGLDGYPLVRRPTPTGRILFRWLPPLPLGRGDEG